MNETYSRIDENRLDYSINLYHLALVQPGTAEATHNPDDKMNGGYI